jgi:nicotinamidase-related amidase
MLTTRRANGGSIISAGQPQREKTSTFRSLTSSPSSRAFPRRQKFDKPAYSAFHRSALGDFLTERNIGAWIISGAETDVCVLSTVLAAVNIGYRVVILEDGLCSSSDVGHDALMTMYRVRYTEQIDLIKAEHLVEAWADVRK